MSESLSLRPVPFQLAAFGKRMPSDRGWIFERKYDGYRAQLVAQDGDVRIFTRGGNDWTGRAPCIVDACRALGHDVVLDGEICATTADGRTDLSWLGSPGSHGAKVVFHAFDVLRCRGIDRSDNPLSERRRILGELLSGGSVEDLRSVPYQDVDGGDLLAETALLGHEGIIAKRADAPYRPAQRSTDWLKFKNRKIDTLRVIGWRADRAGLMASLVLASDDNLHYRGRVGTGFTRSEREEIQLLLGHLRRGTPPFPLSIPLSVTKDTTWAEPLLAARIEYLELSSSGVLREPVFRSWALRPLVVDTQDGSRRTRGLQGWDLAPCK